MPSSTVLEIGNPTLDAGTVWEGTFGYPGNQKGIVVWTAPGANLTA